MNSPKCPLCGYQDPFHPSWYTPEKEVAEPQWVEEWDPELMAILREYRDVIIEHLDGDYVYHLTRRDRTVERQSVAVHRVGQSPQERAERKNLHLKRHGVGTAYSWEPSHA